MNTEDYDHYVKALYNDSTLAVTRDILSDNVEEPILSLIEESSLLLKSWTMDEQITASPAPSAEIVALSYLMSNTLSLEMNVSYCHHPRLLSFLRDKYKSCDMNDSILRTLEKSFDQIIENTQRSCSNIYDTYHQMMSEYRSLNIVLKHYNSKY